MRYKEEPTRCDLYKKRYLICFYEDNETEDFVAMFETFRELCQHVFKIDPKKQKIDVMHNIHYALKTADHRTKLLGRPMRVYLIDARDEDDEIETETTERKETKK